MSVHYGYPDPETEQPQTIETMVPAVPLPPGQTLKGRIEAVLFMTGKALSLGEISQMVDAPYEETEFALVELMGDYNFRDGSSLEIDDTDGYILQVKEEYGDIVNKMMPLEMSAAELRTLSAIAIKAPVLQSDLIEWRGSVAYEHIAQLLQRKLISKRREGRSYILNVTRNFHEYFKLTADKKDLASLVKLIGKEESTKSSVNPALDIPTGEIEEISETEDSPENFD
jgi:segregation and condensation protein B